jgi:enoyl-CoA hydratase/carnithine racemase
MASTFKPPPPKLQYALVSFPTPNILLVTLNRPKDLNCINQPGNAELSAIWTWFDNQPELRVAIITGAGRAFSAGADLKGTSPIPNAQSIPRLRAKKVN